MTGGGGADTLNGGNGNDTLIGGHDADTVDGGLGTNHNGDPDVLDTVTNVS